MAKKYIDKYLDKLDWEIAWKEVPVSDSQSRFEDDSQHGSITVVFSGDGDGWIGFNPDNFERYNRSFRFRVPILGGGESGRVRKALMVLALAIKADNEERPQQRGNKIERKE